MLLPTDRRQLTKERLPREITCCSAANCQCNQGLCRRDVPPMPPCLKSLLSEVPNKTSTPGPMPVAFTRVVVDISGTVDVTPLQDAFTPFLGARHFHEEQERCFPCILSDFRLWFGHFRRNSLSSKIGSTRLLAQLLSSRGVSQPCQ